MSNYFDELFQSTATATPTRAAIEKREAQTSQPTQFFGDDFPLFQQICERLGDPKLGALIASEIDIRLANGKGNGWRFAELPQDGAAMRHVSSTRCAKPIGKTLDDEARDELIKQCACGRTTNFARWLGGGAVFSAI